MACTPPAGHVGPLNTGVRVVSVGCSGSQGGVLPDESTAPCFLPCDCMWRQILHRRTPPVGPAKSDLLPCNICYLCCVLFADMCCSCAVPFSVWAGSGLNKLEYHRKQG